MQQVITAFSVLFILWVLFEELNKSEDGEGGGGGGLAGLSGLMTLLAMPFIAIGGLLLIMGKALYELLPLLPKLLRWIGQVCKKLWEWIMIAARASSKNIPRLTGILKKIFARIGRWIKNVFKFFGMILSFMLFRARREREGNTSEKTKPAHKKRRGSNGAERDEVELSHRLNKHPERILKKLQEIGWQTRKKLQS